MLKKHAQFFKGILFLSDIAVIIASWVLAYYLRFYTNLIPADKGISEFGQFFNLLVVLVPIYILVFRYIGLYRPMRSTLRAQEFRRILNGSFLSLLIFIAFIYLFREYKYSRVVFFYFFIINVLLLSLIRFGLRSFLIFLRKKGGNLRHVLIIGSGELAEEFVNRLLDHPEFGFKVIGFIANKQEKLGTKIKNIPVLGLYKDIKNIKFNDIDQVVLALASDELRLTKPILESLKQEMVEIKLVPDLSPYFTLRKSVDELDGMPIINLRESPIYGWNELIKRFTDLIFSFILILILSPLMAIIAIFIKLTSPGPIFFTQDRMGLDGRVFKIIKFRSMKVGAEDITGPIRATENDSRRTKIGVFLRKYSLDELPQFFNVLFGEMSLVGPRPERPILMEKFKKEIPEYMLRHKVKAGITGWAQINGLRGNTPIDQRTKYDLYYIEHWTLLFDLQIILRSMPFLTKKNAY
ncbi:MAG: undecaprenyl-phosphate glucose phosphotransferase [Patescibacteria group bacterium]